MPGSVVTRIMFRVMFETLKKKLCPTDKRRSTFAVERRHNGGASGAPLKPLRDDSALRFTIHVTTVILDRARNFRRRTLRRGTVRRKKKC